VAQTTVDVGSHSITKGTSNTFIFFVSLEIEEGAYSSKIDNAKEAILEAISRIPGVPDITYTEVMNELNSQ